MAIGSDFECLLKHVDTHQFVPAVHFGLPSKSGIPVKLYEEESQNEVGYIHRDNVMLEMGIPPATTSQQLQTHVIRAMKAGQAWLKKQDAQLVICDSAMAIFQDMDLQSAEARELGCDADYVSSDYGSERRDPLSADLLGMSRYAGAHVHISYTDHNLPAWIAAKMCDLFIGLPHFDKLEPHRAEFYGALSLHRPTSYPDGTHGVEYRVLDNFWIHSLTSLASVSDGAEMTQRVLDSFNRDLIMGLLRLHSYVDHIPIVQRFNNERPDILADAQELVHKSLGNITE